MPKVWEDITLSTSELFIFVSMFLCLSSEDLEVKNYIQKRETMVGVMKAIVEGRRS